VKTLNLLRLVVGYCLWALHIAKAEVLFEHQYIFVASFGVLISVAKKKREERKEKKIYIKC
jgi:hypothetical protein